jgi:hypothetical protein
MARCPHAAVRACLPSRRRDHVLVGPHAALTGCVIEGDTRIATGDLNGTGRWTFEQDGPEVVITYDWQVSASKPLLRRLTWPLRPLFAANHRWAMARGEESLRLELRRRRATTEAERRRVPPPPPPTFRWLADRRPARG